MAQCLPAVAVALAVSASLRQQSRHSCYYFVNYDSGGPRCGGRPGISPHDFASCVACATAVKEPAGFESCTPALIDAACHGIAPVPPGPGPAPPGPESGALALTLLSEAAADGAVCLDGTAPGYYWRTGRGEDRNKFLLVLNGGGWCVGNTTSAAKLACAARATGALGSSKHWASVLHEDAHGMTSTNCTVNPAFCRWSVAYIYYCDGTSFSGDAVEPVVVPGGQVSPIYFRGKRVLDANLAHLNRTKGLGAADAVVLSGHSAGGLATYLHADHVRAQLPVSLAFYAAVPDAGFFLDHATTGGEYHFGAEMRITWALANGSSSYNPRCVAVHSGIPSDCIFPQNFAQYLRAPLHVTQSQYDSWQLANILKLGCDPPKGDCSDAQMQSFQQYRRDEMTALNVSGLYRVRPGYAIFNDACIAHTQGYYGDYMDNKDWEVPAKSGLTLSRSLELWLSNALPSSGDRPGARRLDVSRGGTRETNVHIDLQSWPQNEPCAKPGTVGNTLM